MTTPDPVPLSALAAERRLFHFTHIGNLPTVLRDGLLADSAQPPLRVGVGDRGIKEARRHLPVNMGAGGHPADYVPFYFAPRSPMLFSINGGRVPEYTEGQEPLAYAVTTIARIQELGLSWVYSDGNCGSPRTNFHTDLARLDDVIDWALMRDVYWADSAEDPTRVHRRMAEFLVHGAVPLAAIAGFATLNEERADEARPC